MKLKEEKELRRFAGSIVDLCRTLANQTEAPFLHRKRKTQMARKITALVRAVREECAKVVLQEDEYIVDPDTFKRVCDRCAELTAAAIRRDAKGRGKK